MLLVVACRPPSMPTQLDNGVLAKEVGAELPKSQSSLPVYAPFNFLIDSLNDIYYYQLDLSIPQCAAAIEEDRVQPPFIGLQPQNIVRVPRIDLKEFIQLNVLSIKDQHKYVSVASEYNLHGQMLNELRRLLIIESPHILHSTRHFTQEERVVLSYKKSYKPYNSYYVAWDSSKIRFAPPMPLQP